MRVRSAHSFPLSRTLHKPHRHSKQLIYSGAQSTILLTLGAFIVFAGVGTYFVLVKD